MLILINNYVNLGFSILLSVYLLLKHEARIERVNQVTKELERKLKDKQINK